MGLNISKGNMYEFITHTWNTVKGECPHDCSYCYMKRWGKLNPVRFDEKELKTNLGSGNFIFVGSSCDMWAKSIPWKWIVYTLEHMSKFPNNKYIIQTKNPSKVHYVARMFGLDKNISICTTIETNRFYGNIMRESPHPIDRSKYMSLLAKMGYKTLVTIEPIMKFDLDKLIVLIQNIYPYQVNIGGDSGNNDLPEPSAKEVKELIHVLNQTTKVKAKQNLKRILK
jgi:DNA repair photolyase